jgi:acetyl esterase/lipase
MSTVAWFFVLLAKTIYADADSTGVAHTSGVVTVDAAGTVHVPAHDLPLSIYMSEEAKRVYIEVSQRKPMPSIDVHDAVKLREYFERAVVTPLFEKAVRRYPLVWEERELGGVRTIVVAPKDSSNRKRNDRRVLINLHGGGFLLKSDKLKLVESLPVAALSGIKVVSVDYRLAPEHKFPAASEDVAAVYRALLNDYPSQNIGIYGHSAGGALVGMVIAWLQRENLPPPGAIGIFSSADAVAGGDSRYLGPSLEATPSPRGPPVPAFPNPPSRLFDRGYLAGANMEDALVLPIAHPDVLARFPPALLVTGTRDYLASSVIETHRQLTKAGVDARLHVWDGMWHWFMFEPDLPEAQEMQSIVARFFDRHLGSSP